jgi:hypothetical protein
MGRINKHNYEAYLLDFSEGNLNSELQVELELFLMQHPELDIDLTDLLPVSLANDSIPFSEKNKLKRSESDLISETQFISYIENQLSVEERIHVEKSCDVNPSLLKELNLYKITVAVPETEVLFKEKNKLKRKPKVVWFDFSVKHYAAAACMLFLIGLVMLWPGNDHENQNNQLASTATIHSDGKVIETESISPQSTQLASKAPKEPAPVLTSRNPNNQKIQVQEKQHVKSSDSILHESIAPEPVFELNSKEPLIATSIIPVSTQSTHNVVQIITENDDDVEYTERPKKKGLWAAASKALKNLNQVGVKSVNGDENSNKDKTAYALTLGGLNIVHKPSNL